MRHPIALLALALLSLPAAAQRHEILSPGIATLRVTAGDDWLSPPVTTLGGEPIKISFDELSHRYRRYTYRLEHRDADWSPSEGLFPSDYVEGFAEGLTIDDRQESVNTCQPYTHYELTIPNADCRLKMSGNYLLTVIDETEGRGEPVLTACFMVSDGAMALGLSATTNTDLGHNTRYQQLSLSLAYGETRVTDPAGQLHVVALQNGSWASAVRDPKPQYVAAGGLRWDHAPELVFHGGDEYRKFETLDTGHPTMGVDRVGWDGERFHAYLFPDEPRPHYAYDESANGSFLPRNSDGQDNDTASDYLWVHFTLRSDPSPYPVYLDADWTCRRALPQCQMRYDPQDRLYHAAVLLKQGYYSYRYVRLLPDGAVQPLPSEGDFHETENQYQALVYYRAPGDRADRLVAYAQLRFQERR